MEPRLVTLTLNPALDLAAEANAVVPTHKIRMHQEHADPGGGGVNVARVLHELGGDVLAIVAAGGASGRVLEEIARRGGRAAAQRADQRADPGQPERAGSQQRAGISLRP